MGSSTIRALAVGVFLTTLLTIAMEVDSVQVRPMYGRPGPPSTTLRMRRDPPSKTMMMMSPNGARSPPSRRQFYNNHYRQVQRPRKSPPPTQFHYGQAPKRIAHASYSTHKSHYVPFPKQEYGSRRPTYKYSPVGNRGPPKYHRPSEATNMKPHHTFGDSFPTKTKYNNGFQKDFAPSRRPPQHTPTVSPVSFPSAISDNAQVIKGTREKPTYQQNYAKPSYNSYIATTEQSSHSDYFAAPVSTSFHAVEPSHHSSSQLSSATYGSPTKTASEASKGLQSSIASFPNSPPVPQAFAVSSGSPAVSYSYIEHGTSVQQPASSNYGVAASATQKFQAPASQSFGFVPYSDNGQSQGLTQTVQFPSSIVGGQRPTRTSQKAGGESHILSPNYYDSPSSHSISVSASIPAFESHTSFDQSDATSQVQSSSNDDRYTQVAYPSNHRSSYEPGN